MTYTEMLSAKHDLRPDVLQKVLDVLADEGVCHDSPPVHINKLVSTAARVAAPSFPLY